MHPRSNIVCKPKQGNLLVYFCCKCISAHVITGLWLHTVDRQRETRMEPASGG